MTKERFLSIFEKYTLRTRGCDKDSAKSYIDYLKSINKHAIDELGYYDYLEWIADCSSYDSIMRYIKELEISILSTTVSDSYKSKQLTAIELFKQFVRDIFDINFTWPQFGDDKEITLIKYRKGTDKSIQVVNLCVDIKNEYIRVVDFAKHIFGNLFDEDTYNYIPVVLNPDKPISYHQATEEYLNKLSRKREQRQDTTEGENEILDKGIIACPVLAQFYRKELKIEIYYQNTSANSREEYLSILKNVLAHEYMHYLHYCYCNKIGKDDTFKDDSIREGIAEFFAMLFSLYRDNSPDWLFAEKKYWSWTKMFGSGWPYADALYLYKVSGKEYFYTERIWDFVDNGCVKKLVDILKYSTDLLLARKIFEN